MSNRKNYRRGEERRSEHGPRFENPDPGKGCNATHVARGRRKWKTRKRRDERRIADRELIDERRNLVYTQ